MAALVGLGVNDTHPATLSRELPELLIATHVVSKSLIREFNEIEC